MGPTPKPPISSNVQSLGGSCLYSFWEFKSRSYSVVVEDPALLPEYATPATEAFVTPFILPSTLLTTPVSGFTRRFCPLPVTIRIRSTVGLKSNPAKLPFNEGEKAVVPIVLTAPVVLFKI